MSRFLHAMSDVSYGPPPPRDPEVEDEIAATAYALSQKWEGCFPTEAALDLLMRRAADDIALRSPADRDAVTAWYAARYPVVVRIAS